MSQSLIEQIYFGNCCPHEQQTEPADGQLDALYEDLNSLLAPEAKAKLEEYLSTENSTLATHEARAFRSGCQFAFRFVLECLKL